MNLSLQVLHLLFPSGKKKGAKWRGGSSTMEEASKLYGEVRNKFILNILVRQYLAHIGSHRLNAQSLLLKDMTEIDWSYKEWAIIDGSFFFFFFFF